MSDKPTVSVVIPAYNCRDFIDQTLQSALAQTFQPQEILVADSSGDGTSELLKKYPSPVRVITHTKKGAAAARNMAMAVSTGKYIAFLDSDDLWEPAFLENQVAAMEKFPEAVLSFTDFRKFGDVQSLEESVPARQSQPFLDWIWENRTGHPAVSCGDLYETLVRGNVIATSAAMIRRSIDPRFSLFDESFQIAEDYEYWLRLARTAKAVFINRPLAQYRVRQSGLSGEAVSREIRFAAAQVRIFEKHLSLQGLSARERTAVRDQLAYLKYRLGVLELKTGNRQAAFREIGGSLALVKTVGLRFAGLNDPVSKRLALLMKPYFALILSCLKVKAES